MARVALIFLFAFCVLQLSAGARVVRDAESASADATNTKVVDDLAKNVEAFFKSTFNKENMEKGQNLFKEFSDTLAKQGKTFQSAIEEQLNKLKEKEPTS